MAPGKLASSTSDPGRPCYILPRRYSVFQKVKRFSILLVQHFKTVPLPGRPRPMQGWQVGRGGVSGQGAPPEMRKKFCLEMLPWSYTTTMEDTCSSVPIGLIGCQDQGT